MGQLSAHSPLTLMVLAAWLVVALLALIGVRAFGRALDERAAPHGSPQVAIIIPVRGVPPCLDALWASLRAQTHTAWRVIFAVESVVDPVHAELRCRIDGTPYASIVVTGIASDTGQKVHSQLAALATLNERDEVVVFADADIVPLVDWLQHLVAELPETGVAMVSGYRWLLPENTNLATACIAAMNLSIATLPRLASLTLAWGGTMAIRRETLRAIDIEQVWRGSILDDLPLSRAVRQHGGAVLCPASIMVPSPVAYDWHQGITFVRRQYLLARMYEPFHWCIAAAGMTAPLLGWAVALPLAISGDNIAIGTILLANLLDQCRASLRRRIVRRQFGDVGMQRLADVLWLDRWATPACLLLHAALIWSTAFGRTIRWGGRVYRVQARRRLRIVAGAGTDR